jgi:hypothetical protein
MSGLRYSDACGRRAVAGVRLVFDIDRSNLGKALQRLEKYRVECGEMSAILVQFCTMFPLISAAVAAIMGCFPEENR